MALLTTSAADLEVAAQRLREGKLVAFPTETVYGLGANAFSEAASLRIFEVKGRPPTDPLICHVPSLAEVNELWDQKNADVVELGLLLGASLWPGPITLVAPASERVAPCVTGGSGYVGVRIPDHAVAVEFLRACGVPVAAPSANTFGHVSPTTAAHVVSDLANRDKTLTVIEGGSSLVGIESTVAKLHPDACTIEILRRGKVSVAQLERALQASEKYRNRVTVTVRDTRSKFSAPQGDVPMDGPGQLLTHYSPSIPSYLVTPVSLPPGSSTTDQKFVRMGQTSQSASPSTSPCPAVALSLAVVLDFNGILEGLLCKTDVLAYRSLSDHGSVEEACREVFDALRWVETVKGAEVALFPLLSEWTMGTLAEDDLNLLAAVEDRLFRAASGKIANIQF